MLAILRPFSSDDILTYPRLRGPFESYDIKSWTPSPLCLSIMAVIEPHPLMQKVLEGCGSEGQAVVIPDRA